MSLLRKLAVVIVVLLSPMAANADLIRFELSGASDAYFGPVVSLSGSFVLDTNTPLSELFIGETVGRFSVDGGIFDFHVDIDGLLSLDVPNRSPSLRIGSQRVSCCFWEGYFGMLDGENAFSVFDIEYFNDPITAQEWMDSPDPVADYFLSDQNANTFGIWTAIIPDNPDYPSKPGFPRGYIGGIVNLTATSIVPEPLTCDDDGDSDSDSDCVSVPEPGTLALLGIGLFGMGLSRRRRKV